MPIKRYKYERLSLNKGYTFAIQSWTSLVKGNFYIDLSIACCVTSVVSDSVRPHGLQPTRLLCPWDSPGKNTGVGCHFLLQCMKVESESEVSRLYLTLSDSMDCSLPGHTLYLKME